MAHPNLLKTLKVILLTAAALGAAEEKATVPYPDAFRSWKHVKSTVVGPEHKSFPRRGGIHHFYGNDPAMEGYRTGKFPNGSMIVEEIVFGKDGEGESKGILLEGDRRTVNVMVKNSQLYTETGGWGYESYEGDSRTGMLTSKIQSTCHACHSTQKDRDNVFSSVRK